MTGSPPAPDVRPPRTSRVPGALAIVAALDGAGGFVLGTLILLSLQGGAPGGWSWVDVPFSMMFGGTFGALVGCIATPLTGSLFFRHVPLGRAMAVTAIGTLLGATIGWYASRSPALGGCAGFLVAAVFLRLPKR